MKPSNRGFSLVELMTVLAVVAIIVTIAVPSFADAFARQKLKAAGETFMGNMYLAKSEALRTGKSVYFSVRAGDSACYGFNVGSPCDCATPALNQCTLSRTGLVPGDAVGLSNSTITPSGGNFEAVRGTVTLPGTVSFVNSQGQVIKAGVSSSGRVYSCSPAGTVHINGYASTNC